MDNDDLFEAKGTKFANGAYVGWISASGAPIGEGKYVWKEGDTYVGGWKDGSQNGVGRYTWSTDASYRGEWRSGAMHGVGTWEAADGSSRYRGSWYKGLRHGLGLQVHDNGDVYEGLWKLGALDGPGRYMHSDGNEYDGMWRGSRMHGAGTFAWSSGERYDGEWKDGRMHGWGAFTAPDGSTYDGHWRRGRKHGLGLYRPAPLADTSSLRLMPLSRLPSTAPASGPTLFARPSAPIPVPPWQWPDAGVRRQGDKLQGFGTAADAAAVRGPGVAELQHGSSASQVAVWALQGSSAAGEGSVGSVGVTRPLFLCFYHRGVLSRETALRAEDVEPLMPYLDNSRAVGDERNPTWLRMRMLGGGAEPGGLDGTTARLHHSHALMVALQLGIRYSTGRISHEPLPRASNPDEYSLKVQQEFPRSGSEMTPVHPAEDFTWTDYAPVAFRRLRELAGADAGSYVLSLCSDQSLRRLALPSKRGSTLFLSQDERFLIKAVTQSELALLLSGLPAYHTHLQRHPNSLLCRFLGAHAVTNASGKKYRYVVMANAMPPPAPTLSGAAASGPRATCTLHRRYGLKGFTQGRNGGPAPPQGREDASLGGAPLRELDTDMGFRLPVGLRERLLAQLRSDCSLLETLGLTDYGLLLGVAFLGRLEGRAGATGRGKEAPSLGSSVGPGGSGGGWAWGAAADEAECGRQLANELARVEGHIRRLQLDAAAAEDLVLLARGRLMAQHGRARRPSSGGAVGDSGGANTGTGQEGGAISGSTHDPVGAPKGAVLGRHMAAIAVHKDGREEGVVLWCALIDLVRPYSAAKRIEAGLRGLLQGTASFSTMHPATYSARFQAALARVFVS